MRKGLIAVLVVAVLAAIPASGCGSKVPVLDSVSPDSGTPGTAITLTGSGFGSEKGKSVVQFSGSAIGVKTWSDTEIAATVPSDMKAGGYTVTVVTDAGTSAGKAFKVKAPATPQQPQAPVTQTKAIEDYALSHEMFFDNKVNDAQVKTITRVQTSAQDPTWELWSMDAGQGEDVYYFLVEEQGDNWVVINGGFWENKTPQDYGAPDDLKIPLTG